MTSTQLQTYKYKVNDQDFETPQPSLTGAQIRQQVGIGPDYQLFLEVPGEKKADKPIGDDTVVDFDHGLNTCIRLIRAALGEKADSAEIIETVHGRPSPVISASAGLRIAG